MSASTKNLSLACDQQSLRQRPRIAVYLEQRIVAAIGINLQNAGEGLQVALGMLLSSISRSIVESRRRRLPAERPVIPDIGPDATRIRQDGIIFESAIPVPLLILPMLAPGLLRHLPVYAFEQITELRRCDHHRAVSGVGVSTPSRGTLLAALAQLKL